MRKILGFKAFWGSLGFWAIWIIVLAVNILLVPALLIGFSLLFQEDLFSIFAFNIGTGFNAFFLILGLIYGLLAGLVQWIVLRRRINQAVEWIWATLFGTVLGWVLASIIPVPRELNNNIYVILYPVAVSSIFSSIAQWFVIRKEVKLSYVWILLSILGWSSVIFFGVFSRIVSLHNFYLPGAIFGCMLIATAAVFLFSRREQRNFNSIILGGISLLFVIGWGIPARITYRQLNQQTISFHLQQAQLGSIESVVFSPDGTLIAGAFTSMGSDEGDSITVCEINSGKELFSIPSETGFYQMSFSPDGSILASVDHDLKVKLWDVNTGTLIRRIPVSSGTPRYLAFSPDSKILAIGNNSSDGMMTLWDTQKNQLYRRLQGSGAINSITMNTAGKLLVARPDKFEVWDVLRGEIISETPKPIQSANPNNLYAFSPDGKYLVEAGVLTSERAWKAYIWDLNSGELLRTLDLETKMAVAFSPDSEILAFGGSSNGGIRLFDTKTWEEIKTLLGGGSVTTLAFSSDGNLLAAGATGGYIRIFEVR